MADKTPIPHSAEAEQSVLGILLVYPQSADDALVRVDASDFYGAANIAIYEAIASLVERNAQVDPISVADKLKASGKLDAAGGMDYLKGLAASAGTEEMLFGHLQIIRETSKVRQLMAAGNKILEVAGTGDADAQQKIELAQEHISGLVDRVISHETFVMKDLLVEAVEDIDRRAQGDKPPGIPTGFDDFDRMVQINPGDLVVIAGRPSMGKTAYALQLIRNITGETGLPGLVFSLEMPKEQLVQRFLAQEGRIEFARIRNGLLHDEDWDKLTAALGKLHDLPLHINDQGGMTPQAIRSVARKLKRRAGLGAIAIDYLQLIKYQGREINKSAQVGEITADMKNLGKELGVPVILLSQLNRKVEDRQDKRPLMSDLRESGAVEQDADVIAMLYRDEYYNPDSTDKGVAEALIRKNRNGAVGTVGLAFEKEYVRFSNLANAWQSRAED